MSYQPSDEAVAAANTRRHNGHGTHLQLQDAIAVELTAGRLLLPGSPMVVDITPPTAEQLAMLSPELGPCATIIVGAARAGQVDITLTGAGPYEMVREDHPAGDWDTLAWTDWHVIHESGAHEYSTLDAADAVAVCAALNGVARGRAPTA